MGRNRLEKVLNFPREKNHSNCFSINSQGIFKIVVMKSNNREYINHKLIGLKARIKGTSQPLASKGTIELEKVLFMSFETWLFFLSTTKLSLNIGISALHHVLLLGCIFKKVVVK